VNANCNSKKDGASISEMKMNFYYEGMTSCFLRTFGRWINLARVLFISTTPSKGVNGFHPVRGDMFIDPEQAPPAPFGDTRSGMVPD